MNCYVHNEEFLKIFLENDGPQIFVNTVKIINEEQTLKQIIIFIHAVVAHKEICKRFLKDRLYASYSVQSLHISRLKNFFVVCKQFRKMLEKEFH